MPKTYLNPDSLFESTQYGFSQIVKSRGGTTVYLSGQVAWDTQQQIGSLKDLGIQTRRTLENVERAVVAAGGRREDIVSMRIYIVAEAMQPTTAPVREALLDFFPPDRLPTSTWIGVPCLAHPDFLIEIEAIAVIEDADEGGKFSPGA